jgi:hypothetical protein
MKTARFTYKKGDELTNRKVLVLDEATEHIGGLDLSLMSEAEEKVINDAIEEMYAKLKPYIKYYRKFLKDKIQGDILQESFKSR